MKKSLASLIISHIQNIFWTIIWSPIILIFGLALFANEMDDFYWNAVLISWIVQVFVTVFIHLIFLVPSYFWQQHSDKTVEEVYAKTYTILLIPTAIYLLLTSSIFNEVSGENSLPMVIVAMFCFITIYSISLYTLLQKIIKIDSHEK